MAILVPSELIATSVGTFNPTKSFAVHLTMPFHRHISPILPNAILP
jgi:hypothetical protein